ncbi:TetR/AcrR family transcriptional regulator [Phenylobacterium aquaticum]|uniref:TetR/AcrR family transcriptional regulator n=1 Tax=Phenylobacterium aquaticum TaxID=1763816 RepID=UPI001F5D21FF|nr:TetR/AcrR family transcriptional regulator [Phenylobacterium aquaticum]MCI3135051.1 TetR family transcriptional regulator [Phenylobacterium aquaticum]
MSSAANPPKPRTRYAAKRDAIMAAATQVFSDQGVSGFTLAAVAKRMDLHPVSLTYYFKRKEDLAAAVLHETIRRFGAMLELAEQAQTGPERLRRLIEAYFEVRRRIALGQEAPLASFSEIRLIGGEVHRPLMDAFWSLYVRMGRLLKSEAMPWMTAPRRHALARLLVDQLGWADSWLEAYAPEDYGRVAARLAEVMIEGVAGRGRAWPDLPVLPLGAPEAQNDEVTRESFLVAATRLINREGYRGASVDKISAELKVTKGSFYHHNADKDELAVACFLRSFDIIDDARRRAAQAGANGWERVWLNVASLALYQASSASGRLMRNYATAAVPHETRKVVMRRFRQIGQAYAGLISDGIADGSLRAVDPFLAAQLMLVVFNSSMAMDPKSRVGEAEGVLAGYVRPALMGFFVE